MSDAGKPPFDRSDDIITVFARLALELDRLGLERPVAVLLKSHDDGMRLLAAVSQRNLVMVAGQYGKPIEHSDGSVWMELEIYGMTVRWPALRYALPDGGFKWN